MCARPSLSPLGLLRTLPGQRTRQVAEAQHGAPSTWSKPCVRTEWLSPPPPRPLQLLPASPLGGREQLRAAWRPPWKLFPAAELLQKRVSELVPRWGATGVCRPTHPTCIALIQLRRLLQDSFLKKHPVCAKCLPQKRFWKAALGEEAVAGRICIGCAGFRTDRCWKRRFRRSDFSVRGGPRAFLERSPRVRRRQTAPAAKTSQKVPKRNLRPLSHICPLYDTL